MAKIEDQSGIANFDEMMQAADAVMVARGDLGIEVPMEDLPLIQRKTVDACVRLRKPVIVATHLLESMMQSPVATRAEVSDVAGASGPRRIPSCSPARRPPGAIPWNACNS